MKGALTEVFKDQLKKNIPEFNPGDTIRVKVKIVEAGKTKYQSFEGVVIRRRGEGSSSTFTIRRISHEVGIEQTFPLHGPNIVEIKRISEGKVRRAKLYYLRKRSGKATTKVRQKVAKRI